MNKTISYFGADQNFWGNLKTAADSLSIPCRNIDLCANPFEFNHQSNAILIFDQKIIENPDLPPLFAAKRPHLGLFPVLLTDNYDRISQYDKYLYDYFEEILPRHIELPVLTKKLTLYANYISLAVPAHAANEITDVEHLLLQKKNVALSNQIAALQKSLTEINSDKMVQDQVIDKINQISHLSRQINCLDLRRIASVCIEKIPRLIAARFASLYTLDAAEGVFRLLHHNHPYAIEKQIPLDDRPDSPMTIAVRKKKLLLIEDLPRWATAQNERLNRPFNNNYQSNSCIVAPLLSGGDVTGVLNLADKIDGPAFDISADLAPVQLLCEIIGSAMSNIKLYEAVQKQAQTDGLTGLLNHRTFYLTLARETQRANRYGTGLSLMMIDMDNLKKINDRFGHQVGDSALMHISDTISQCIRETDLASRYGGDEFAAILPNTTLSDALIVAERLIHNIDNCQIAAGDQHIPVTISIGLTQYQPGQSVEEFARIADHALLEAKNSGKNRIHIAESAVNHTN